MRSVLIVFHVIAFSFFVVKNIKLPDSVLKLDECHCCLNASSASWRTDGDTRLQQNHTRSQFIRYFNRNKKTANKTDKTFQFSMICAHFRCILRNQQETQCSSVPSRSHRIEKGSRRINVDIFVWKNATLNDKLSFQTPKIFQKAQWVKTRL